MKPLSIGELFAGIGGLGLGLTWGLGGAHTRWQVEYEEHARLILAQHWPDAERHKDVRDVGRTNLAPVDLICGGFPCQPHSVAGKRQASADERDLWAEFARIIGEVRPRWVVAENVPGLLSSRDPAFSRDHAGGFFGRVLRDLAQMGFDAEWACFPAASVGAHHRRDRVFLIAWNMAHADSNQPERNGERRDVVGTPRAREENGEKWERNGNTAQHRGTDVADPSGAGREEQHTPAQPGWAGQRTGGSDSGDVAHAEQREGQHGYVADVQRGRAQQAEQARLGGCIPDWAGGDWEQPSPLERGFRDVAHGPSLRVAELTRLGNGVVPQQAAVIGRAIRDAEAHWQEFGVMPERIIRPEHWRAA